MNQLFGLVGIWDHVDIFDAAYTVRLSGDGRDSTNNGLMDGAAAGERGTSTLRQDVKYTYFAPKSRM